MKYKLYKCIIIIIFITFQGLFLEVIGPTLQDIMHVTDSSYSSISNAMSMRGAGLVAGSALGIYLTPNQSAFCIQKMGIFISVDDNKVLDPP